MKQFAIVVIGVLACLVAALAAENYRQREIIREVAAEQAKTSLELTKAKMQIDGYRDTIHQLRSGRID